MINNLIYMFMSFSTGVIVSSAIFAFITIIGLIPRLIIKTNTQKYITLYENIIILSGFLTAITYSLNLTYSFNILFYWLMTFCLGIFTGSLAVCLAEVIDILPIISRKFNMKNKTKILMLTIAISKGLGAFAFYFFKIYERF